MSYILPSKFCVILLYGNDILSQILLVLDDRLKFSYSLIIIIDKWTD